MVDEIIEIGFGQPFRVGSRLHPLGKKAVLWFAVLSQIWRTYGIGSETTKGKSGSVKLLVDRW